MFRYERTECSHVTADNESVKWWYEWRDSECERKPKRERKDDHCDTKRHQCQTLSALFRVSVTHNPDNRTGKECNTDANAHNRTPWNETIFHESKKAQQSEQPYKYEYKELSRNG